MDDYPQDLTWFLYEYNDNSEIIHTLFSGFGTNDTASIASTIIETVVIDYDGCFSLTIFDSWGDGLRVGDVGWYQLFLNNYSISLGTQTIFWDFNEIYFCTDLFEFSNPDEGEILSFATRNYSMELSIDLVDYNYNYNISSTSGKKRNTRYSNIYDFPFFIDEATLNSFPPIKLDYTENGGNCYEILSTNGTLTSFNYFDVQFGQYAFMSINDKRVSWFDVNGTNRIKTCNNGSYFIEELHLVVDTCWEPTISVNITGVAVNESERINMYIKDLGENQIAQFLDYCDLNFVINESQCLANDLFDYNNNNSDPFCTSIENVDVSNWIDFSVLKQTWQFFELVYEIPDNVIYTKCPLIIAPTINCGDTTDLEFANVTLYLRDNINREIVWDMRYVGSMDSTSISSSLEDYVFSDEVTYEGYFEYRVLDGCYDILFEDIDADESVGDFKVVEYGTFTIIVDGKIVGYNGYFEDYGNNIFCTNSSHISHCIIPEYCSGKTVFVSEYEMENSDILLVYSRRSLYNSLFYEDVREVRCFGSEGCAQSRILFDDFYAILLCAGSFSCSNVIADSNDPSGSRDDYLSIECFGLGSCDNILHNSSRFAEMGMNGFAAGSRVKLTGQSEFYIQLFNAFSGMFSFFLCWLKIVVLVLQRFVMLPACFFLLFCCRFLVFYFVFFVFVFLYFFVFFHVFCTQQ